jgi:hypothetical protein
MKKARNLSDEFRPLSSASSESAGAVNLVGARKMGLGRHAVSNYTHETVPTQFLEANGIRSRRQQ